MIVPPMKLYGEEGVGFRSELQNLVLIKYLSHWLYQLYIYIYTQLEFFSPHLISPSPFYHQSILLLRFFAIPVASTIPLPRNWTRDFFLSTSTDSLSSRFNPELQSIIHTHPHDRNYAATLTLKNFLHSKKLNASLKILIIVLHARCLYMDRSYLLDRVGQQGIGPRRKALHDPSLQ